MTRRFVISILAVIAFAIATVALGSNRCTAAGRTASGGAMALEKKPNCPGLLRYAASDEEEDDDEAEPDPTPTRENLLHSLNSQYVQTKYEMGLEDVEYLLKLLDTAKAAGISDSQVLEGNDQKPTSVGALRKEMEALVVVKRQRAEKKAAKEEAKWLPYTSIVKGDRVYYLDLYRGGIFVYGPGGVVISTPEQFRDATGLFTCSKNRNVVPTEWTVSGAHFMGDKSVGGGYTATGVGTECPSSAFK